MSTKKEKAIAKFLEHYNCAQSVLYSFCDELQIDRNTALKIACGFGAGMGRNEEVCGAVSGGIIAIGAKYGRGMYEDRTATELVYAKTQELMKLFSEKHGSYICRDLLNGCELTTEQGRRYFRENDLMNRTCRMCVDSVVEILEGIM